MCALQISLSGVGKKFGSEWIFRNVNDEIYPNDKLVILGGNGSGKSTLLQVISGFVSPNEGAIKYNLTGSGGGKSASNKIISPEDLKNHIAFASPYLQLVEDFTLTEMIGHAAIFKPFLNKLSSKEIIELIELSHAKEKFIRQFSSGMKQRLKLGLAILSDTSLLLLDEPVSNLDKESINWYKNLIGKYTAHRTVIVCSNNIEEEYFFCTKQLNVMDFKKK